MNKWLFWAVVGFAAFWIWKLYAGKKLRQAKPDTAPPADPNPGAAPALILACAHCGVHLPQSDAVSRADRWYCSTSHALAGPRS